MSDYDNSNSGALFINDSRTKDSHPQARGSAEIVCPHCGRSGGFWISAWTKVAKSGKKAGQKFQSLAFTQQDEQPVGDSKKPALDSFDDDIPF